MLSRRKQYIYLLLEEVKRPAWLLYLQYASKITLLIYEDKETFKEYPSQMVFWLENKNNSKI